jgi:hypothetical protein
MTMKKVLFSMLIGTLAVSLLSSCETEQITPTKSEDTLVQSDPPAGGGPTGDKVAPKKATLIVK